MIQPFLDKYRVLQEENEELKERLKQQEALISYYEVAMEVCVSYSEALEKEIEEMKQC